MLYLVLVMPKGLGKELEARRSTRRRAERELVECRNKQGKERKEVCQFRTYDTTLHHKKALRPSPPTPYGFTCI